MRSQYTLRRSIRAGDTERVSIDNGTFNDNFLVRRWFMFPNDGVTRCLAVLNTDGTHPGPTGLSVDNNREFGWAIFDSSASSGNTEALLDPDHIIVQDFYIHNLSSAVEIEVIIHIERVRTSDAEAALYMIKERSQGPLE